MAGSMNWLKESHGSRSSAVIPRVSVTSAIFCRSIGYARPGPMGTGMASRSPSETACRPAKAVDSAMSGCAATQTSCPALWSAQASGTIGYRWDGFGQTVKTTRIVDLQARVSS
jgi:hypothetical protein